MIRRLVSKKAMAIDFKAWEGYRVIWLRSLVDQDWIDNLRQADQLAGKLIALVELGQEHNQLGRFVTAIGQAVQEAAGNGIDPSLQVEQADIQHDWIALINQISELPDPLVLVLAGYDRIENLAVHKAVAELLDFQPEGLQVILFCQSSPPLPLPRLRARRMLLEIIPGR